MVVHTASPTLRSLRQKDCREFKTPVNHTVKPYLKKKGRIIKVV